MLSNLLKRFIGKDAFPGRLLNDSGDQKVQPTFVHCRRAETSQAERGQSFLTMLTNDELKRLNDLLPWSCFILDAQGRTFGKSWSASKRSVAQEIPDYRILELHRRCPLDERDVLEIGCFEGVHTVALTKLARRVVAVDSRIENVVKTIVRCAVLGTSPVVFPWDVERGLVPQIDISCDVLHHVGVLYHLVDPVQHLREVLPWVRETVMLDTHVASTNVIPDEYLSGGERFKYQEYKEGGREKPFAGMADHAKWLYERDLVRILQESGFAAVDVAERRSERNGPRVLIYASRPEVRQDHMLSTAARTQ